MSGSIHSSIMNVASSGGSGVTAKGQATLSGGTVTVSSSAAHSNAVILAFPSAPGSVLGILSIGTITDGVSFVINSTSDQDSSAVNWIIA